MPDAEHENQPEGTAPKHRRSSLATALVVVALMAAEAVVIFGAVHLLNKSPAEAGAAEAVANADAPTAITVDTAALDAEVPITEVSAYNKKEGRLYVFHLQVTATAKKESVDALRQLVAAREATIRDRIQTVIRAADPQSLNEPGMEIIRRQIKFELNEVFGRDDLITGILIPKFLQSRTNL